MLAAKTQYPESSCGDTRRKVETLEQLGDTRGILQAIAPFRITEGACQSEKTAQLPYRKQEASQIMA